MGREYIVVEGRTLDDAINLGLSTLNRTIDEVDIEILEKGKSILNLTTKTYKIKMISKIADSQDLEQYEVRNENGKFELIFKDNNHYLLIHPPTGTGQPVSLEEILIYLEENEINNIDIEKIKTYLNPKESCSISIKELVYTDPIDAQIEIELAKDEMEAYMWIIPPKGGKMISQEEILETLKRKNIVFGIDYGVIEEMCNNKQFDEKKIIAVGKQTIDGQDGRIQYLFDTDVKIRPELLKDGKVDFKELNIIQTVKKGDCLAEVFLPTNGIDGITVTGKLLKAKSGKIVSFKKGKNVIESNDGLKLIAEVDGQPKLIDNKVTVLQVYEVHGNVDNATGNIHFTGNVVVRGNVRTGFKIECSGNVEVYGVVEGAIIIADGDIILHKGIQGQNVGKLLSKQNIVAKYMENCYANAYGKISSEVIMHCKLETKKAIEAVGKRAMIVGGEIRARNQIDAKVIGSPMATATKIEVGVDPEVKERYESLKQEREILHKNKESVTKAIELLTKLSHTTQLTKEKQDMLIKSVHTEKYLSEKLTNVNETIMNLQNNLQTLANGKVNAFSIIYAGVRISIGNSVYYVRDHINHCTITRDNGEIKINPYIEK
ncbi:FapA family protein [Clostridiaceae bacterium 35-E11]